MGFLPIDEQMNEWTSDRENESPSYRENEWPSDQMTKWPSDRVAEWTRDVKVDFTQVSQTWYDDLLQLFFTILTVPPIKWRVQTIFCILMTSGVSFQ